MTRRPRPTHPAHPDDPGDLGPGGRSHPAEPTAPNRLVLPLAVTIGVAFGAVLYGFSVLITATAAGAVFSASVLSSAFGGSVLVGGVVAVPVGRWVDRAGIRPVVATGASLVGAGFGAFSLAQASWQVLVAWWVLIGPGSAMVLFEPAFVAIQRWFTPTVRNRAAGTLTLVTGFAGPIFVPATTVAVASIGWRATAASLGALVAGCGLVAALVFLRDAPWEAGPVDPPALLRRGVAARAAGGSAREARSARETRSAVARRAPFVLLTVAVALLFGALEAVQVHRIARFEAVGFGTGVLATWAAVASLASLPGRFLVPRLADRFDAGRLMTVLLLVLVPSMVFTIRGTQEWEMVGHFLLFGAVFGATIPMRAVLMGDRFGGPSFGALMGIQAAAIAAGRSFGPAMTGWLRDLTGAYGDAMAILTVAVGLSAVLVHVATPSGAGSAASLASEEAAGGESG